MGFRISQDDTSRDGREGGGKEGIPVKDRRRTFIGLGLRAEPRENENATTSLRATIVNYVLSYYMS